MFWTVRIEVDCIANVFRNPVPSGAFPATSTLSSIRSAMPVADFQLVLSSKSERYGLRNIQTPPMIVMTMARSMTTPKTSLTACSSRRRRGERKASAWRFTNDDTMRYHLAIDLIFIPNRQLVTCFSAFTVASDSISFPT